MRLLRVFKAPCRAIYEFYEHLGFTVKACRQLNVGFETSRIGSCGYIGRDKKRMLEGQFLRAFEKICGC